MKVSIIGSSGKVAKQIVQAAYSLNTEKDIDIVLLGQHPDLVKAYILDLQSTRAFLPSNMEEPSFQVTSDYADISKSDYTFVCAGKFMEPAKKEKFREIDPSGRLAHTFESLNIIYETASKIKEHSPDSKIIMITNQSDMMAQVVRSVLPADQVYGFGGMLDEARFKKILSTKINETSSQSPVKANEINVEVIGYHNNDMLFVKNSIKVPQRANEILTQNDILLTEAMQETKGYGREISKNKDPRHPTMHTGASIGPGYACWASIAALSGQTSPLKASFNVHLDQQQCAFYELDEEAALSVPMLISKEGFSKIQGSECNKEELDHIKKAVANMKNNMKLLDTLQKNDPERLEIA